MLKITGSSKELAPRAFNTGNNEIIRGGSGKGDKTVVDLSKFKNKKFKKLIYMSNVGAIEEPNFLTLDAKKAFNHLQLTFIKAPILRHFDPKCYIQIETDVSSYFIGGVLSQLNLDFDALPNDLNRSDFDQ